MELSHLNGFAKCAKRRSGGTRFVLKAPALALIEG
jgi:hypothetical protein